MNGSSKHRSPSELNVRDREHYEVSRYLSVWFDKARFVEAYERMYPQRNVGSIIPSDYCVNRENKGNATYPRFLEWDRDKGYRFVGLGGTVGSSPAVTAPAASDSRSSPKEDAPPTQRVETSRDTESRPVRRFLPWVGASLTLDAHAARAGLLAYNNDARVNQQELHAASELGFGFTRTQVDRQLRALDKAYSTRSVGSDLSLIAERIEAGFDEWSALLANCQPLEARVPDAKGLQALMGIFLGGATRRIPRSLATKALHFAAPRCFVPADAYAVDLVGRCLQAGSWSDTASLEEFGMSQWYHDYLTALHRIGKANEGLLKELIRLDEETSPGLHMTRVRGLPKILDKILWWIGQPGDGRAVGKQLFE